MQAKSNQTGNFIAFDLHSMPRAKPGRRHLVTSKDLCSATLLPMSILQISQAVIHAISVRSRVWFPQITRLWLTYKSFRIFINELQTNVCNKRHKVWLWTAVNHWRAGIIAWAVGDRSSLTFQLLWIVVKCWQSFGYIINGYAVYPKFIDGSQHIISKTYMTRVKGENTRLRHYDRTATSENTLLLQVSRDD